MSRSSFLDWTSLVRLLYNLEVGTVRNWVGHAKRKRWDESFMAAYDGIRRCLGRMAENKC